MVSVENQKPFSNLKIHISPNPGHGNFNVALSNLKEEKFEVFNNPGILIKSGKFHTNKFSIDLSAVPSGVYYVKFAIQNE